MLGGQRDISWKAVYRLGVRIYSFTVPTSRTLRRASYVLLLSTLLAVSTPVVARIFSIWSIGAPAWLHPWEWSAEGIFSGNAAFLSEPKGVDGKSQPGGRDLKSIVSSFVAPPLSAPLNLIAPSVDANQVQLQWDASAGAVQYEIERRQNITQSYEVIGSTSSTSYPDTSVGSVPATYLYRVVAVDGAGNKSAPSNTRLGTTVTFTDNPLADPQNPANTVLIKAEHITQLRTAVNLVRAAAGLPAATWTYQVSSGALIHAKDVEELRTSIDAALSVFGFTPPTYTDASLSGQVIKRAHIQELRQAVNWGGTENSAPAVILTSPVTNASFISNSNIQLTADASDSDGNVVKVEFFQGATKLGEDSTSPYSFSWNNVASGSYSLTARATDNNGYQTTSSSVPITVSADFNSSRLDPDNATGGTGENPLSRNFNWSLPLVGLPGRAGLNLGLTLSYNSLVWTKDTSGTQIKYDADLGFPSPGFRLGFPVIEQKYYSSQTGKYTYLVIMPSGSRVELRQLGTTKTYEAVDSSYLQLTEDSTANNSWVLRTTDGSQLFYTQNGYRCNKIQDRNGNFISIAYYDDGRINTITDTLGRVIYFNYDVNGRLSSITQQWKPASSVVTYKWAEFTYANQTIQTGFSGITVLGPQNNSQISLLKSVKLADQSSYEFTYNNYGQVYQIKSLAADAHELSHVKYIMDSPTSDCPRFTERRDYAENWNGGQEVVTTFSAPSSTTWTMPDDSVTFTGKMCQVTTPDSTATKIYYPSSGWNEGLPLLNETVVAAVVQRWVRTKWTQDDENLSYQQNPRVKETIIGDPAGNRKRTIVTYQSFTPSGGSTYYLPVDISEGDATTILRHVKTDYNTSPDYTSLRIIGLADTVQLFEGADDSVLLSKMSYKYDEAYSLTTDESNYLASQASLIQHDSSYGTGTTPKRANLTSILRWDVENSSNEALAAVTRFGYDIAGSVIFVKDALNHKTSVRATDAYSAGNIVANTFAYPTTLTDAGGFSNTSTYNYDTGAATKVTNPLGAEAVLQYDDFGRLTRKTLRDGLAGQQGTDITYTSYEYFPSGTEVRAYTLLDVVNGAEVKSLSLQRFDGAGRVIGTANNHPGSQGQYSGQKIQYDVMGRVAEQTNPTEINDPRGAAASSWTPVGDDSALGWKSITQAYDWKGRPTITTNVDSTTKQASYDGCGCAGGEKVTLTDEAGKSQNVYHDVLGRVVKTEVLNMDANHSVYTTVVNTYNARDQITNIRQYEGTDTSNTYQDTVMTYDGHGRLLSRKAPEQTSATIYSYYADDMLESVTDARGAITTYTYNSRHLVTAINYTVPSGVAPTANAAFDYDAAGNRLWMTDGQGRVDYQYNRLSRLTSEMRTFNDFSSTPFTLTYDYTLTGALKSVTDPFGAAISYGYDSAGRLNSVSGTGFGAITQFATDMKYRAWGALKSLSYDSSRSLSLSYNARQEIVQYKVLGSTQAVGAEYEYYADGRIRYSHDLTEQQFDRLYSYDHMGRLTQALTGSEARGINTADGPYNQTYGYDVWGNMTERTGRYWSHNIPSLNLTYNSSTNRNSQWGYDNDGRITQQGTAQFTYDAAGRLYGSSDSRVNYYDGDGRRVKRTNIGWVGYEIRSSVLGGQIVVELDPQGQMWQRYIYGNGTLLATHSQSGQVTWEHISPSNSTQWNSLGLGAWRSGEFDPTGTGLSLDDPYAEGGGDGGGGDSNGYGNPTDLSTGCMWEGMQIGCSFALKFTNWRGYINKTTTYEYRSIPGVGFHWMVFDQTTAVNSRAIGVEDESWSNPDIHNYRNYIAFPTALNSSVLTTTETEQRRSHRIGTDPNVLAAISTCADSLFGVGLITFKQSVPGSGGYFEGILKDGSKSAMDNSPVISVSNNVSYTGATIPRIRAKGWLFGNTLNAGKYDPHTNYTASDADTSGINDERKTKQKTGLPYMLITQVHELGNSLSFIISGDLMFSSSDAKKRDQDPGQAFEDCFVEEYLKLRNKK